MSKLHEITFVDEEKKPVLTKTFNLSIFTCFTQSFLIVWRMTYENCRIGLSFSRNGYSKPRLFVFLCLVWCYVFLFALAPPSILFGGVFGLIDLYKNLNEVALEVKGWE